jgi:hypothetical protein
MKKFEELGRSLNKAEQKMIFGGYMALACPEGQTNYSCCVSYADNTPDGWVNQCATSQRNAETTYQTSHPNMWSIDCNVPAA